ncbi:DUF167 domain-containing protein [Chloroflexota bacterium]
MTTEKEQCRFEVRVQPNAGQNSVTSFQDGVLRVRIAAPPVKGKANQELVEFLSRLLGVNKSSLSIEKGMNSKRKTIAVMGLEQDHILRLLENSQNR